VICNMAEWNRFALQHPYASHREPRIRSWLTRGVEAWRRNLYKELERPMRERILEVQTIRMLMLDLGGLDVRTVRNYEGDFHPLLKPDDADGSDTSADGMDTSG